MRNNIVSGRLHLLDCVVEEEVEQDCIDFCVWDQSFDLLFNELHGPDATSSDLDFESSSSFERNFSPHATFKRRRVRNDVERVEYLRNAVIGEDREGVDIMEGSVSLAIETGPKVCD